MGEKKRKVAIIGAGAAGMAAAVSAAKNGVAVTVFERNAIVGKKLLLTGNGRCNFSNMQVCSDNFSFEKDSNADRILMNFTNRDAIDFFAGIGVMTTCKREGYYPFSGQASAICSALYKAMLHLGVDIKLSSCVTEITQNNNMFQVKTAEEELSFDAVILACGGKAAPKTGSDGYGFRLARGFGHTVSRTYPVLVQLNANAPDLKKIAGVRCEAVVTACVNGKEKKQDAGELQLTEYGLSGIPVFNISRSLSKELEEGESCTIIVDFLPNISMDSLKEFVKARVEILEGYRLNDFLEGMVHSKLAVYFTEQAKHNGEVLVTKEMEEDVFQLLYQMKHWEFLITGHRGFENAQVTKGGVLLSEVDETLQSVFVPGLYFAGEMLDVDADCGGYNLHWAWASGILTGEKAAK